MNIDKSKFGEFIYKLRKEKGMTQKELAEHLHVTKQAISKWECGNSYPDIEMFESLAEALDISIYELFNGEKLSADFIFTQQQIEQTFSQFINSCKNELSYKLKKYRKRFIILLLIFGIFILFTTYSNVKAPTFNVMSESYSQKISNLSRYNGLVCEQDVEYTGNINEEIAEAYIRSMPVKEGTIARHVKFYKKNYIYNLIRSNDEEAFGMYIYMTETEN